MKEFVDASMFLGMHSMDEELRIACKNYFVSRLGDTIGMSFEQVGKCDDAIWRYPRKQQDAYYPFMDYLHTTMDIQRIPYDEKDIRECESNPALRDLDISDRLTAGMALAREAVLYSIDPRLLNLRPGKLTDRMGHDIPTNPKWLDVTGFVRSPQSGRELDFPQELEELYQQSLEIRI